jgi:hypothetical protein
VRWPPACKEVSLGAVKTVTENTNLSVIVVCKEVTSCVLMCPIDPITNSNPIFSHSVT